MKKWLSEKNTALLVIYCILIAMVSYTCMYGIRIPYKAAKFEGLHLWGIHYKVICVISQVFGYMCSKFIGIKIISELKKENRLKYIIGFNLIGLVALLLFAITPFPYSFIWMFINGLPLGMMFGLVFSYLEGRRITEFLSLGLAISIIVSSGYVKTVGKILLNSGIPENWMPFITGSIFFGILLITSWFITQIPDPDQKDIETRTKRISMTKIDRWLLFKQFAPGLISLILVYTLLTVVRDYRDTFMVEIWNENGFNSASLLTTTELPIALVVLLFIGFVSLIKKNSSAFYFTITITTLGSVILVVSSFFFSSKLVDMYTWTITSGLGIFLGYIVFNTVIFERMIAAFKIKGNFGFLMYLADSIGYLGSIGVLIYKEFSTTKVNHTQFLLTSSLFIGCFCIVLTIISWQYFRLKNRAITQSKSMLLSTPK